MKIGSYKLYPVSAGKFALDGGAMFGIIPKPLWSKTNPPDDMNRIALAMRCLLLKSDKRIVLIDNGAGNKYSEKQKKIYTLGDPLADLDRDLMRAGVTREAVTDLILTHLHFDHAGGTTSRNGTEIVLNFPNARHYIQKSHWEHALNPTERDKGSFMKDDYEILGSSPLLELLDGPGELFPGLSLLLTDGHTTSQQLPLISDGTASVLFCGDLVPTVSHLPFVYMMGYDIRPLFTLADKKRYLKQAFDEKWILFFEHDPETVAGELIQTDKGFSLGERRDFRNEDG